MVSPQSSKGAVFKMKVGLLNRKKKIGSPKHFSSCSHFDCFTAAQPPFSRDAVLASTVGAIESPDRLHQVVGKLSVQFPFEIFVFLL